MTLRLPFGSIITITLPIASARTPFPKVTVRPYAGLCGNDRAGGGATTVPLLNDRAGGGETTVPLLNDRAGGGGTTAPLLNDRAGGGETKVLFWDGRLGGGGTID
jgi:hypothetical protein